MYHSIILMIGLLLISPLVVADGILYVKSGCPHCEKAETRLVEACIPFVKSTDREPTGILYVPVLHYNKEIYTGSVEIEQFARTHNQCDR